MSVNLKKRRPKVYLAGSCSSTVVSNVKSMIKVAGYSHPVIFIDPRDIMPKREAFNTVEEVNNQAINECDLFVCVMINQTAGAAIELYICKRIYNKPAMIATGVPIEKVTPRVRSLTDAIFNMEEIIDRIDGWLQEWYE